MEGVRRAIKVVGVVLPVLLLALLAVYAAVFLDSPDAVLD